MFNPSAGPYNAAMQQQRYLQQTHQQQHNQITAATQLASAGNPGAPLMPDTQQPPQNPPGLDNFGNSGGLSFALDAANAAKQMAALQAAGRSRAQSHPNSGSQPGFPTPLNSVAGVGGGSNNNPPAGHAPSASSMDMQAQQQQQQRMQHAQNVILNAMLTGRPPNFLPQLAESMAHRGTPLPPSMTGVPSPTYDPSNSRFRGINPGSSIGTFSLCGKDLDLHMLLIWVIQRGGSQKIQYDEQAWESFLTHVGLPRRQNSVNPTQPPIDMVHVLKQHYLILLQPFEGQWTKVVHQKVMGTLRQQQQNAAMQQAIQANGGQPLNPQQMGTMQAMANANVPAFGGAGMPTSAMQQQQQLQQQSQQSLQFPPQQQANGSVALQQQQQFQAPNSLGGIQHLNGPQSVQQSFTNSPEQPQRQMSVSADGMPHTFNHSMSMDSNNMTDEELHQDSAASDQDSAAGKRKRTDTSELDGKRPRLDDPMAEQDPMRSDSTLPSYNGLIGGQQQTSPTRPSTMNGSGSVPPTTSQPQPRLKVQYRPLFRTLNSYGGRNFLLMDREKAAVLAKRSVRPIEEWGEIDIEGVIMSLRSRVGVEIAYALSALLAVSIAGKQENAAFPLHPCEDLIPVLVDLLKDVSLPGMAMEEELPPPKDTPKAWTHQDLIKLALDDGAELFGTGLGWASKPGRRDGRRTADSSRGPVERPAEVAMMVLQLFRNLSIFPNNAEILSNHPIITDIILRLCSLQDNNADSSSPDYPEPISPIFTLTDLVKVHDHALHFLANTAPSIKLEGLLPQTPPRIFRLLSSYLISPLVAVSPFHAAIVPQSSNQQQQQPPFPPATPDLALDAFSRISQRDQHRKLFATCIPAEEILAMFSALTRMLPVSREDFTVMTYHTNSLEPWVGYAERIVLSLYSLVFLAPPSLKRRMKRPGVTSVVRRLSYFYMKCVTPDGKSFAPQNPMNNYPFMVISRRAIEILKLMDHEADSFAEDPVESGGLNGALGFPTFGIGYGEPDAMGLKAREEGVGLLAGSWEDVVMQMMCCPGVDDEFFIEMDSLVRMGGAFDATAKPPPQSIVAM